MIIRLFGIIDILAALSFLLILVDVGKTVALIIVTIILIKSIVFFSSLASIIDMVAIIFFVLALFGFFSVFTWLSALWLLQKGIMSVVMAK